MSGGGSWKTPSISDVVMLTEGFEGKGQNTGPHYGLVVARFKLQGSYNKFLLIAPGSSIKGTPLQDSNTELLVPSGAVVGRDTLFYFRSDLLRLYEFPSDSFEESLVIQSQSGIRSPTKGVLQDTHLLLCDLRAYHGRMVNFYKKVLTEEWNVNCSILTGIVQGTSAEFLE